MNALRMSCSPVEETERSLRKAWFAGIRCCVCAVLSSQSDRYNWKMSSCLRPIQRRCVLPSPAQNKTGPTDC